MSAAANAQPASGGEAPGSQSIRRLQHLLYLTGLASLLGPSSISIYVPSLVSVRDTFDATNTLVGATVAVFTLVLAISQLLYGPLVDRFSGKTVLLAGLVVYGLASLLAAAAPSIGVLIAARALQGAGVATGLIVGGALIMDLFPPARRAAAMGMLQTFNGGGAALAPLIGSLVLALGFTWRANFVVLAVAGGLVALGVAALLPRLHTPSPRLSLRSTVAALRFPATLSAALLGSTTFFADLTLFTFTPVVLREHAGLAPQWIGPVIAPETAGVALGAFVGGRLADRWGRRRVALVGAFGCAATYGALAAIVALVPHATAVPLVVLAVAGYGLAMGFGVPAQLALMVEWQPAQRGAAVGTYAAVRYGGAALGPLVGGVLVDQLGLASPFVLATLVVLAAALLGVRLLAEPPGEPALVPDP